MYYQRCGSIDKVAERAGIKPHRAAEWIADAEADDAIYLAAIRAASGSGAFCVDGPDAARLTTAEFGELAELVADLRDWPGGTIGGCGPHMPFHGYEADTYGNDPPFHAPADPATIGGGSWPRERCPTCGGRDQSRASADGHRVGDVCLNCDSADDLSEARATTLRSEAEARRKPDKPGRPVDREPKEVRPKLSEKERRELWNACMPGSLDREIAEDNPRLTPAKREEMQANRSWLRRVHQAPDWDIKPCQIFPGHLYPERGDRTGDVDVETRKIGLRAEIRIDPSPYKVAV